MTKHLGGGPAFPETGIEYTDADGIYRTCRGMSLRDWFAGQALSGVIINTTWKTLDEAAISAYIAADEMLKKREKDE